MLRRFREILSLREKGTLFSSISTRASSSSVASKLFRPDIIFIYPEFIKRSACCLYHHRRACDVIDRAAQVAYVRGEHFRADVSSLSLPSPVILGDAREGRNKPEPGISPLQFSECIHEGRIFEVAVRVEQKNRMTEPLRCSVRKDTKEWRDPDSAGQQDSRPGCIVMESK